MIAAIFFILIVAICLLVCCCKLMDVNDELVIEVRGLRDRLERRSYVEKDLED